MHGIACIFTLLLTITHIRYDINISFYSSENKLSYYNNHAMGEYIIHIDIYIFIYRVYHTYVYIVYYISCIDVSCSRPFSINSSTLHNETLSQIKSLHSHSR